MALFELEWLGGTAERLFAKHRGDRLDTIDWRALPVELPHAERDHLRTVWTQSAHQEWCAAGAFTALIEALLLARAPVDLIGMAGSFVADEMVHVELTSRMAMAYGGGVPLEADPDALRPRVERSREPWMQAAELAIRVSCVGESFSLPLIASELASAMDPTSRAVLGRIAADEAPHARVGWLVLDWLEPRLAENDREQLALTALDAIDALRPALQDDPANAHFYARVLHERVVRPLATRGIPVGSAPPGSGRTL